MNTNDWKKTKLFEYRGYIVQKANGRYNIYDSEGKYCTYCEDYGYDSAITNSFIKICIDHIIEDKQT